MFSQNNGQIEKIFKLQNRAARIILNVKTTQTSTVDIFRVLKWMPIQDYFIYRKLLLAFKVLKGMTPEYMNVFRYRNQVSSKETRSSVSGLLYVPKSRILIII